MIATLVSLLFIFLDLIGAKTLHFPRGFHEKRFNVEAVPTKNGEMLLHLKGGYGKKGINGPMGDQGPPGIPGSPGPMGEKGPSGVCSPQLCDAIQQASSLLSRITNLEQLVMSRGLSFDQPMTKSANGPILLHITSDILVTRPANISNGGDNKSGLPRNINFNIALKNGEIQQGGAPSAGAAPKLASFRRGAGKFLINSTVFLEQRSKIKKLKNGIGRAPEGGTITEKQLNQKVVPSIRKNRIPHQ